MIWLRAFHRGGSAADGPGDNIMVIDAHHKTIRMVAVYARVSTGNQENERTIETQLSAINTLIAEKGYTLVQKYADEGWSGDALRRPALDQLRMDAKKKQWDAVVIYDPDRLARRGAWQEVVVEELKELGIEVIYVTVPTPKSDEDIIMYKMRGVFAEYERMKIQERFRLGKVRKAKEGHILVTEAPYGYTFIKKRGKHGDPEFQQGHLEVNETERQVVTMIFRWVADEGLTLRSVIRRLQELSIAPRRSKRGVWNTSTLSHMLRNRTYIGEGHYGASYAAVPFNPLKKDAYKKTRKTSRRLRPKSEWILIKTPALIERDMFDRAQVRLKANFTFAMRNTRNSYLLAGTIWCPCGRRRAGEGPQRGKHLYYRCTDRQYSFPLPPSCHEKAVNARVADHLLWQMLCQVMSSPDLIMDQARRYIASKQAERSGMYDLRDTEKEVAALKVQETRYVQAFGAGALTVEQLKAVLAPIRERLARVENHIQHSKECQRQSVSLALPKAEDILCFAKRAASALPELDFKVKKAIVRNVIDRVVGTSDQLSVYGFIPLKSNVEMCTSDRNGSNINQHNHVELFTSHRYGVNTKSNVESIPFNITIDLPPPRKERAITQRDGLGRIQKTVVLGSR
jgi:site-specific DNA recombinase